MDEKETKAKELKQARGNLLLSLLLSNKMTDEFISKEELEALRTKTYPEWPEALQAKLQPFGAEMIQ